jgi:hypothetical protein
MANLAVLDASGATKYIKADGDGTNGDPHVYRMGSGAADDAAAAGELYPIAGIFQASADEVDNGDLGRIRMTRRRAIMTAGDYSVLTLTGAAPIPAGSDIVMRYGAAVNVTDIRIRDTSPRFFLIPLSIRGWRNISVFLRSASAFDQAAAVRFDSWKDTTTSGYGQLLNVTMPAAEVGVWFMPFSGAGASLGESVGDTTMVSGAVYTVPAMRDSAMLYLGIRVSFSVAPITGELELTVVRST